MRVSAAAALTLTALGVAWPVPAAGTGAAPAAPGIIAAVRAEASWIRDAQLPDGAIEPDPGDGQIAPYSGNYAALGLARAAIELHERADAGAAWRWLLWYQAHQDATGFVTDYEVSGGTETSTQTFDSTDAYAGTFLAAAAGTWQADPDRTRLRTLAPGIARSVAAIEATQAADGLTGAKPGYLTRLLMDNAEAYGGLRSAAVLATALGEQSLAGRATADARRIISGVASLWNRRADGFDWARTGNGTMAATSWTVLYPDAMENAWAVAYGLASQTQAAKILTHLEQQQPRWAEPDQPAAGGAGAGQQVGYWPVAGWAFTLAGQRGGALDAALTISSGTAADQRVWPFTTADAGELIALQSGWPSTAAWATPLPAGGVFPGPFAIAVVLAIAAVPVAAGTVLVRRRRKHGRAGRQVQGGVQP